MDLKQRLGKLKCHFTWDLGCSKNELKTLLRNLENVDQVKCSWLLQYYNLLGYTKQALGSDTEALMYLHKAESVTKGNTADDVLLQVNKANLAWVYFYSGKINESVRYLEEVEELQQKYPAPSGCDLHPEVSGEKGWTLVKLNDTKKREAIEYFKTALKAKPERKEWQRGLAMAMSKIYKINDCSPELKKEILKQLKIAHENDPNILLFHALYLKTLSEVEQKDTERQMQDLLEKALETEDLECLGIILRYFGTISKDKAIKEAERAREKFPESSRVLKHLANSYKWKVYDMNGMERRSLASDCAEMFEKVVRDYPDSLRERLSLASMYENAGNINKADDVYQHLLTMKDDFPPHSQQCIYHKYAWYLHSCNWSDESINYHMEVAKISCNSAIKQKSITILKKNGMRHRNPRYEEICSFLESINIDD